MSEIQEKHNYLYNSLDDASNLAGFTADGLDVVEVDHTSTDYGEIITTIVYRKVIKKVDPWGDKTSEDD